MPVRKPKDPNRSPDLPHDWITRQIDRLEKFLYYDEIRLETWQYRQAKYLGPNHYEFLEEDRSLIHLGEFWGGKDITAFFHTVITIPEDYCCDDIVLDINLDGGEAQLKIDGYPWQGLDWNRSIVPLGKHAIADRPIELDIEAFVINFPYDDRRNDERETHQFKRARMMKCDRDIEKFLFDARFVLDTYLSYYHSDEDLEIEGFLRHHLEETSRLIHPAISTHTEAKAAAKQARAYLQKAVFECQAYQKQGQISICGHSHLDIVYLWPIKETLRKNCRTTTNMLSLMREYPEYRYSQSQPYLYEKLKELYPEVYEEVRQRIKEGRWETIGAMYVEPDGNVLGPESLVRQILFGKRFLQDEFGITSETCWLPDVFGVMYTLPQILKKSGIKYFCTVKLSIWNDTNVFPYNSFRWRGPDGSEVLTHFPASHFGQLYEAETVRQHWYDFRDKNTIGESLYIYGWADGGGGPTREMVESSLRTNAFPGLPTGKIDFAEAFFHRLEAKADVLPVWDDELYLEAHRGTYTTKADLKRQNRKGELLYRDAEILSSLAWLFGAPRTQDKLNEGWKLLLVNQFHDTLPGTHRPEGVPDIKQDYESAFAIGHQILNQAVAYLVSNLAADRAEKYDLVLFNTLAWERNELVSIEEIGVNTCVQVVGQDIAQVQNYLGKSYFQAQSLPAMGWCMASTRAIYDGSQNQNMAIFEEGLLETSLYRIQFNLAGEIESLYDKVNDRQVLTEPGNIFQVFEDDPGHKFSAWDIAYHFEEYQHPVKQISPWQLAANGPLFAVLTSKWQVLNSTIEQEIWLYAENPRIDFRTKADWRDHRKLLKVAFPLNVRTRTAAYDLPFGNIERATHRNTTWEQAKFEVCGHKWADLSEGNYGVALLNDCKYGYDAHDNVLRLSLLRSPVRPDPNSDIGQHEFTYALLPHAGNWRDAQVGKSGYELNIPVILENIHPIQQSSDIHLPDSFSLLSTEGTSLIVETIKQAEDGNGLVLRLFDNHGNHVNAPLKVNAELESVKEVNLMEEVVQDIAIKEGGAFVIETSPYEIMTYRLNARHSH